MKNIPYLALIIKNKFLIDCKLNKNGKILVMLEKNIEKKYLYSSELKKIV